ncbi:VP6 [Bercke-Baary Melophagus reo-like virus]|nr:VP6 [Bercke-Baary Melophagus reo-like virus]
MGNPNNRQLRTRLTFTERFTQILNEPSTESRSPKFEENNLSEGICIKAYKENVNTKRKTNKINNKKIQHTDNAKGHVTLEDVEAMKRWFIGNWKEVRVIPFEILTLETFLITYFGYTYHDVVNLNQRKYKLVEQRYALFLSTVADVVHRQLFIYENLKSFMNMCKRNFEKQQLYNSIIQSYINETLLIRMGYLVNAAVALELKNERSQDIMIVGNKTRYHTILSWLKKQKFVYIPDEFRERLNLEANYDMIEIEANLTTYLVGYGSFVYTDIKNSPIGTEVNPRLSWFLALNNYFQTQPLLTIAPQIKNFKQQPHLASLIYTVQGLANIVDIYLLVDWEFYNKYKNKSGLVNIHITNDTVLINSKQISMLPKDVERLCSDLTISCQRLTGSKILGDLQHVDIQIRRSLSKMGSFLSQLECSKNKFLSQVKNDVYKLAVIAGKANGKTSLIQLVKHQLDYNVYIEDSDDYGKFITHLVQAYKCGEISKLNEILTEELVLSEAVKFAQLCDENGVESIPSFYNSVVAVLIETDVREADLEHFKLASYQVEYSKFITKLYRKYFTQIRDLYYKLDSGKVVNQKMYENGILNYMRQGERRVLLQFFHIFACNYRRKAANFTMRYESNFDTDVALYARIINKHVDPINAIADTLLKMFYDQSAEYVTSISGPSAFMSLFGLIPVLSFTDSLYFNFRTHLDVTG